MSDRNWKKSSSAYGYVTLIGTDTILVRPGENIRFNQHGPLENNFSAHTSSISARTTETKSASSFSCVDS
jgi:hypothetical protein